MKSTKFLTLKPYYLTGTIHIGICEESETGPTMNARVHQSWIGIWSKESLHTYWGENCRYAWWERWWKWPWFIEEVDIVRIGDVVIARVGFQDAKSTLMTLKQFLEQRPSDVTPFYHNIQTRQKELGSWHAQESHETTIDSFFHYT